MHEMLYENNREILIFLQTVEAQMLKLISLNVSNVAMFIFSI